MSINGLEQEEVKNKPLRNQAIPPAEQAVIGRRSFLKKLVLGTAALVGTGYGIKKMGEIMDERNESVAECMNDISACNTNHNGPEQSAESQSDKILLSDEDITKEEAFKKSMLSGNPEQNNAVKDKMDQDRQNLLNSQQK